MKKHEPMEKREVVAFLARKIEDALNNDDGDISDTRRDAMNYYLGKPYGDERDGYSKVVTREVMEAVEWAMPLIMRVFSSGDRVVSFAPAGPEDEALSSQETDAVRHELFEKNNGFMALYAWVKDCLMYPNGYAKIWADESVKTTVEEYNGLTVMELSKLVDTQDELEVEAIEEYPGASGIEYNIKLRRVSKSVHIRFEPCEPDQVLVDKDLTSVALKDADFICHRVRRSYTWLVDNGYDPDALDEIGATDSAEWNDERVNRLFYEDENPDASSDDDESMRQFWVHECVVSLDEDGDGLAERRRIVMIGDKIFEDEEDDYIPIVAMSAIPMSHKHTGQSLADMVMELQRVMSVLVRNLLDNIYKLNIRRKYVGRRAQLDDGTTLDQLQDTQSEFIECDDETAIREEQVQPIAPEILAVIQEISEQIKTRSGVAPEMSLDPNILKDSTMGAFVNALEQASQRIELITRVFAETGIKQAMLNCHRLMREHMDQSKMIRLRGEWVPVDPSDWRERNDLIVEVGTGFHSKEKRAMLLSALLKEQKELLPLGVATPENLYHTAARLADAAGERNPDLFFTNPAKLPPAPPRPDPQMAAIQAQVQIESEKRQIEHEKNRMDALLRDKEIQLKQIASKYQADSGQVIDIEKIRLDGESLRLKKEIAALDEAARNLDRRQAAVIAEAQIQSRERIEAAKLVANNPPEAPEDTEATETTIEVEAEPVEKVDTLTRLVEHEARRREARMDILADYFAGRRDDESLKDAVSRMRAV